MDLFVSISAPDFDFRTNQATMKDRPIELRKLNQEADLARGMWGSWALQHGGSVLCEAGANMRLQVPADCIEDIQDLKDRYSIALTSRVAIGIGVQLDQSERALQAVEKKLGGDHILTYSEYVNEVLAEDKRKDALSMLADDQDKIKTLNKAQVAANSHGFEGAHRATRPVKQSSPVPTQGEHSDAHDVYDVINDDDRPPLPENTHAAKDFEEALHHHARGQEVADKRAEVTSSKEVDGIKAKLVDALRLLQSQAPVMNQIRQSSPETYQAMVGLAQVVIALARHIRGIDGKEMKKSEDAPDGYKITVDPKSVPGFSLVQAHAPNGEHVGTAEFWHKDDGNLVPEQVWVHAAHRRHGIASAMYRAIQEHTGKNILRSPNQTPEGQMFRQAFDKAELEKAKLPMPKVTTGHHIELPVGSRVDFKEKVRHGDNTTSWVQMREGMVRSKDGHPISARRRNGR